MFCKEQAGFRSRSRVSRVLVTTSSQLLQSQAEPYLSREAGGACVICRYHAPGCSTRAASCSSSRLSCSSFSPQLQQHMFIVCCEHWQKLDQVYYHGGRPDIAWYGNHYVFSSCLCSAYTAQLTASLNAGVNGMSQEHKASAVRFKRSQLLLAVNILPLASWTNHAAIALPLLP